MEKELEDRAAALHDAREQEMRQNSEKLKAFGVPALVGEIAKRNQTRPVEKQRQKRSRAETIPESSRELRSHTSVRHELDDEGNGENMVVHREDEGHGLDDEQDKGRKRTKMHHVYDRKGQPPVPVSFNEKGQPDGDNASEFNNFIATHVKSHIPLGHLDWRQVDVEKKNELMTTLRNYYVVDDKLKDFVMGSAHKKWKDFKAYLRERIYKEERTDEELETLIKKDKRVTPDDCEWLIKFWRSEESKKRSEQGKKNREKQKVLHTSGSKSHARVSTEMHKENGYAPRRDELFVKTHEKKKKPQTKETIDVIEKIERAMDEHPELLEKSIQQGDILAHVLGKEKNGYVRGLGLGAKAAALGMPGARGLKSTRLQMAELEADKAWRANELLKEHVDEIRNDTKAQIDALMEEVSQLRTMVSQSNGGHNNSMLNSEHVDSIGESAAWEEERNLLCDEAEERLERECREAAEQLENKKAQAAILRKKREATQNQKREAEILERKSKAEELQRKEAGELRNKKEAEQLQKKKEQEILQKKAQVQQHQKKSGAVVTQKNHQQGKEVILYNVIRDHRSPVAKGTILSTDRKKIVGGRELGAECCEVVVDYIMKKDAILFRPVGNVTTIGQAQGRTIAWLYKHLEVQKQASPPQAE